MSNFVYNIFRAGSAITFSVGFYHSGGWVALHDFNSEEDAAAYVNYLNGGSGVKFKFTKEKATEDTKEEVKPSNKFEFACCNICGATFSRRMGSDTALCDGCEPF